MMVMIEQFVQVVKELNLINKKHAYSSMKIFFRVYLRILSLLNLQDLKI